jgi:2-polyprenyl-3-methyl-5-hydroxy-6-metoxy-1,4-benzoquinol methylase
MRPIQKFMQKKRTSYFLRQIHASDQVLEIGCGTGWFKQALIESGHANYQCIDLKAPADIVGDILQWQHLGLLPGSFDAIVAFEVVEHVDCFAACGDLLKKGGRLLITTPVPHFDWALKILENLGLNQKRTSPHSNLVYLKRIPWAGAKDIKTIFGLSQWAVFTKD